MIFGSKTTGWPVPGACFGGRQVFIQIQPGDNEMEIGQYVAGICLALKLFAQLIEAPKTNHHRLEVVSRWMDIWASTGINLTHTVETNIKPLMKREIDDG